MRNDNTMKTSARNQFMGTVKELTKGPVSTEVTIEVGPGVTVVAVISTRSAETLQCPGRGRLGRFAMRFSLVTATALWLALGWQPAVWAQAPSPAPPAAALTVKGNVERALTLTVDDLKRFPAQHVEDVRTVREAGNTTGTSEPARRYAGCLLRDVLDRAKPVERNRLDLRKSIVVVAAKDGYRAIFSWAELYLSPIGDGALVIYERNGAPLSGDEGPLALVSLRDTRPGPRHVKWLESIEVRLVSD